MKGWRGVVGAAALAASLVVNPPAATAGWEDAGWGTLSVLTNVVYMPAKVVYAAFGGLTGALALGLTGGDMDTAETVWVASMGGTYVVTPAMLQGREAIEFVGTPPGSTTADATGGGTMEEQPLGGS